MDFGLEFVGVSQQRHLGSNPPTQNTHPEFVHMGLRPRLPTPEPDTRREIAQRCGALSPEVDYGCFEFDRCPRSKRSELATCLFGCARRMRAVLSGRNMASTAWRAQTLKH